jgi:hypothetical protein
MDRGWNANRNGAVTEQMLQCEITSEIIERIMLAEACSTSPNLEF